MDNLSPLLWYLFWVGLVIIAFGSVLFGGFLAHRSRMKELEILKIYAEKGIDPPLSPGATRQQR